MVDSLSKMFQSNRYCVLYLPLVSFDSFEVSFAKDPVTTIPRKMRDKKAFNSIFQLKIALRTSSALFTMTPEVYVFK